MKSSVFRPTQHSNGNWRRPGLGRWSMTLMVGCLLWAGLRLLLAAETASFTNASLISILDDGPGTPYPSTIDVPFGGKTIDLTVTLHGLTHTWGNDIDVLLVGPGGQKVTLMSDAGTGAINDVTLTFSDGAAAPLPASGSLVSATVKPTDYAPTETYPAPASGGPYGTNLAVFHDVNPGGTWSLYVVDDGLGDQGSFAGGWSLTLTTVSGSEPPTISDIGDQLTTVDVATEAIPFTVDDADTPFASLTLEGLSSNTSLVPTNNIVFGGAGANRTVTVIPATGQLGSANLSVIVSDGTNSATDTFVLTVLAANTPPSLSAISNQTIDEDTSTAGLDFIVEDAETSPGSLAVFGDSSNPTLVPTNNIVFNGSGTNRTVIVTPATNQSGITTITIVASDGQYSTSDSFDVTVNPVNDAPAIRDLPDQLVTANAVAVVIPFTVEDVETPPDSLTVSGDSSNITLVATNNIVFSGSGSNRMVTVTPVSNLTGTASITITVSDGLLTTVDSFVLTAVSNAPPTIAPIPDQTVLVDQPTIIRLEVEDAETAVTNLQLTLETTDPNLIRPEDYEFRYFYVDGYRYLTMAGAFGQMGKATNTVTVTDGINSASASFVITVASPPPGAARFANTSAITIPDIGPASLYPSTITVTGMVGTITDLHLTFSRFSHEYTADVSMLLVSPSGVGVVMFSHVGGGAAVTNVTFTLKDSAIYPLPPGFPLWSEVFTPNDYGSNGDFPAPAPGGPYASAAFTNYNGLPANGDWSLYIYDTGASDHGVITGGWSLMIATAGGANQPPTLSEIPDQVTTLNTATPAVPFAIFDAESAASNLVLTALSSNTNLIGTNNIVFVGSGTDRTVTLTPTPDQLGTATITLVVSDGSLSASNSFLFTVNPAPLTVTASNLSRSYGLTNPVLGGGITGLLAGDEITANFATIANTNSPPGNYPITFTLSDPGGRLGYYAVTTNNGTLAVTNALLVVTASNTNKVYGMELIPTGYTVSGLLNLDTVTNVTLTSLGSDASAMVGEYDIVASAAQGNGLTNYAIVYINGTLTVTEGPALLRVTSIVVSDGLASITWDSFSNQTYRLQYKDDWEFTNWIDAPHSVAATGPSSVDTNVIGSAPHRFYRVRTDSGE